MGQGDGPRGQCISSREGLFSATEFPVYGILGNSIRPTTHSRKPYM